jgi:rare lipoprotein A (peptidoglycan hydrolase)
MLQWSSVVCAGTRRIGRRCIQWSSMFLLCGLAVACARESELRVDKPATPVGQSGARPHATARSSLSAGCSEEELSRGARQVLRGFATYYADSLEGNATASGPAYDPDLFTAAHRRLPFGTRLRVTRTDVEQAPVCVTVNDRGPYGSRRRIVDLSRRAAEQLQMIGEGVVPVRVDVF